MDFLTKPCGCRGTGLFQSTIQTATLRKLYLENPDENLENRNPLDEYNAPSCGIALKGKYPAYTSTDLIEIQEEKEINEKEGFTVEKKHQFFLYGCLKCGETWREKYDTKVDRDWNEN